MKQEVLSVKTQPPTCQQISTGEDPQMKQVYLKRSKEGELGPQAN